MKIDFPRHTERLGVVSIHSVQKIYELDSGKSKGFQDSHQTVRAFDYDEISNILHDLAIVVPIKGDKLKLLEGVLSGIPNECLVIVVSNSPRSPVDRFMMEVEMIRQYSRFVDKKVAIVHQKDPGLADFFKKTSYDSILDSDGNIRNGKAEGMVIGLILAKMYHKDYVGFIDSDNYIPGAVNEYVKIFAAGFGMSSTPYCNIRISWVYKPKIKDNSLQFAKWGRISEVTNKHLNTFLSYITGFETEIIKTGNSGEHALSMPLAERMHFSSGYSVEPYEYIDIFEKFGGLLPSDYPEVMEKGVEIFQIETRNPHFHEDRGSAHLQEMLHASLGCVYNSQICPPPLSKELQEQLERLGNSESTGKKSRGASNVKLCRMEPIKGIPVADLADELKRNSITFYKYGGLK